MISIVFLPRMCILDLIRKRRFLYNNFYLRIRGQLSIKDLYHFRSVCSEVGDTSYHSDSYGSQSTLDSRDSPYRDDLGRETVQGPLQPSSRDLQLVQGPRDRPNSLRIPGQSEFNRNNSFCSLPREKVRIVVRSSAATLPLGKFCTSIKLPYSLINPSLNRVTKYSSMFPISKLFLLIRVHKQSSL